MKNNNNRFLTLLDRAKNSTYMGSLSAYSSGGPLSLFFNDSKDSLHNQEQQI